MDEVRALFCTHHKVSLLDFDGADSRSRSELLDDHTRIRAINTTAVSVGGTKNRARFVVFAEEFERFRQALRLRRAGMQTSSIFRWCSESYPALVVASTARSLATIFAMTSSPFASLRSPERQHARGR